MQHTFSKNISVIDERFININLIICMMCFINNGNERFIILKCMGGNNCVEFARVVRKNHAWFDSNSSLTIY